MAQIDITVLLAAAGQFQTEEKVEEILEQENPQIFVESVRQ